MKKYLFALAGIVTLTGLFLTASAMFQKNRNVLRTINNGADLTKKPEDKNKLNILLLGYWDENWDWIWFNTDSFIVVSMDLDKNEITFNPLPLYTNHRTLETLIDNARIAAYTNYWFYTDHYATVNFAAFKEAIDMLWWIDIYVDEAINDTQFPNDVSFSNGKIQLNRDPSRWYAPFNISAWRHHMDWETALKYVRSKKTTSYEDRQHRQQKVLQAVLDKVLTSWFDISQLYNLYTIYNNKIVTDISLSDAISLISTLRGSKVDSQKNMDSTLWWNSGEYTTKINSTKWNKENVLSNWYTKKQNDAFNFAKDNWITVMQNISAVNMDGYVTRAAAARMLSDYAINVLWKKPVTSRIHHFSDVTDVIDKQYGNGISLVYQLWLMWVWTNKFRPYDVITRAEFWTALSRLVYWTKDGSDKYYTTHLAKLKKEWIITSDKPNIKEKKWYIFVMLMKATQ